VTKDHDSNSGFRRSVSAARAALTAVVLVLGGCSMFPFGMIRDRPAQPLSDEQTEPGNRPGQTNR